MKKTLCLLAFSCAILSFPFYAAAQCTRTITGSTACTGYYVTFTTESGKSNYDWTFNGGAVTSGDNTESVTGFFWAAGTWSVSVYYDLPGGCSPAPTTQNVTVSDVATPTISGLTSVCQGLTTTYTTLGGMSNYDWTIDNGEVMAGGDGNASVTVRWTWATTATYVKVKYTDPNGCTHYPGGLLSVNVNAEPLPTLNGLATSCMGSNAVYTTDAGMSNYTWEVSAQGTIVSGAGTNSITVQWVDIPNTGGYGGMVKVKHVSPSGCSGLWKQLDLYIYQNIIPTLGSTTVCQGTAAWFQTDNVSSGIQWTFGPDGVVTYGGSSTDRSISILWSTPGAKTVSVKLNSYPCSATTTVNVNVLPASTPTITGPSTVCQSSVYASTPSYPYTTESGKSTYVWTVPNGSVVSGAGTNSVQIKFDLPGAQIFKMYYVEANGCVSPEITKNVTVNPWPSSPTVTGPSPTCLNSTHTYTTESGFNSYVWGIPPGGSLVSGGTSTSNTATIQWTTIGNHSLTVSYSNSFGCSSGAMMNVYTNALPVPVLTPAPQNCVGAQSAFYSQSGNTNYVWAVSPGESFSYTTNYYAAVNWQTPGPKWVSVNYADYYTGCMGAAPTVVNVTVPVKPDITVGAITNACDATAQGSIAFSNPVGSVNQYKINWGATSTGWLTLPASPIPVALGHTVTTYTVTLYVRNSSNLCESQYTVLVQNLGPRIVPGATPQVCPGTAVQVSQPYSNPQGSPNQYSLTWTGAAVAAGLQNVSTTTLPASPIVYNTNTPAVTTTTTYTANLRLTSTSTGCQSDLIPIFLTVQPRPITVFSNVDVYSGTNPTSISWGNGSPASQQYKLDWDAIANGAGMTDVPNYISLPTGNITLTVPTAGGVYNGIVQAKNTTSGCEILPQNITATVRLPGITLTGSTPSLCVGTTGMTRTYSNPLGTPNEFRVNWDATAEGVGFTDTGWLTLTPTSILIPLPAAPTAGGTFSGVLYVRKSPFAESVGVPVSVTLNNKTFTPGAMPAVCAGVTSSSFSFNSVIGNPNQYRIVWNSGLSNVGPLSLPANSIPITGIPSTPGTYTGKIYLKETSTNCEGVGINVSVTVNAVPSIFGSVLSVCSGTTTSQIGLDGNIPQDQYMIDWASFPDQGWTTYPVIPVTGIPTTPGTYWGLLYARYSPTNCISQPYNLSVTVMPNPVVNISGNLWMCNGGTTVLAAPGPPTYQSPPTTYTWSNNSQAQSITVGPGNYWVTLTDQNGCSGTSPTVNTYNLPAEGYIYMHGAYSQCAPGNVLLVAGDGYNYSWGSNQMPVYWPGYYEVTYTTWQQCTVHAWIEVPQCQGGDPCGGYPCPRIVQDSLGKVGAEPNYTFGVYPNPANDHVMIVLSKPASEDREIRMFDVLGRLTRTEVIEKGMKQKTFSVREMDPGVYILNIVEDRRVRQRKLIIQKR